MNVKITLQVEIELTVTAETFEHAIEAANNVEPHDLSYLISCGKVSIKSRLQDTEEPAAMRVAYSAVSDRRVIV